MARRMMQITLPADANFHNLYDMIVGGNGETGVANAVPTDGIFPDRVQELDIIPDAANTTPVTTKDKDSAGSYELNNMTKRSNRNTICLRDYRFSGSGQKINVEVEFT